MVEYIEKSNGPEAIYHALSYQIFSSAESIR